MQIKRVKHLSLLAAGWISLVTGAIGLVVPLLPTTVFWLIALWCFSRTNPAMQHWLRTHPRLGETLTDFADHGVICRRGKGFAIGGLWVSLSLSLWLAQPPTWLSSVLVLGAIALSLFLATRPQCRPHLQCPLGNHANTD